LGAKFLAGIVKLVGINLNIIYLPLSNLERRSKTIPGVAQRTLRENWRSL